jgi:rSAM/selenodomain-associated transferase 1
MSSLTFGAKQTDMRVALAVMAKAPRAGEVKTRLCPPLTPAEAAELYRCFLHDTLDKVRACDAAIPVLSYAPCSARDLFTTLAPGFTLIPQRGDDLGARMADCFAQLFAQGYQAVALTGSDLPTLPPEVFQQALHLLTTPHIDVVLGPSEDGGYYLIGLRSLHRALFENMTWSTSQVLAETVKRAEMQQLRIAYLPIWYDVDTPDDLARLSTAIDAEHDRVPPQTRQFLLQRNLGK